MKGLEENISNAGPLFQLLLKYGLSQQSVSMTIIRILEGHLIVKENGGAAVSPVSSSIGAQLRSAFIGDFLQKLVLPSEGVVVIEPCKWIYSWCLDFNFIFVFVCLFVCLLV
jgi:hypothetical protein